MVQPKRREHDGQTWYVPDDFFPRERTRQPFIYLLVRRCQRLPLNSTCLFVDIVLR